MPEKKRIPPVVPLQELESKAMTELIRKIGFDKTGKNEDGGGLELNNFVEPVDIGKDFVRILSREIIDGTPKPYY